MKGHLQKNILCTLVAFLFLGSCVFIGKGSDQVYETAIRHYINDWQSLPDTIVVSTEGENPSDNLLLQLSDLETTLVNRNTEKKPDITDIDNQYRIFLYVRTLRGIGIRKVTVEVSSSTSPYDAHGIEYRLERKKGKWVVVEEGPEWMT